MAGVLSAVVAIDENFVIGTADGKLPWKLAADLRMFKIITMNENVVMGANTYRSLPGKLKDRNVHVLSKRSMRKDPENYVLLKSVAEIDRSVQNPFICGGVELYNKLIPRCDVLYVTRVLCTTRGSSKALKAIAPINFERFQLVEEHPFINETQKENEFPFVIQKWVSKKHFARERMGLHTIISPELSVYENYKDDYEFWHNPQE